MAKLSETIMRSYLRKSISSINTNKLNGLLAEYDLRRYIANLGYGNRTSPGGWIVRTVGAGSFGHETIVFFPEIIPADVDFPAGTSLGQTPHALHSVGATFHQIGLSCYYCVPTLEEDNSPEKINWKALSLSPSSSTNYIDFPFETAFTKRDRKYNFLRYNTDTTLFPTELVADVFAKEHSRITFVNEYLSEISDVDGVIWGEQYTYPIEIKEKTVAQDNKTGLYFGLDLGPFVKLAFYAERSGNLKSLFIVREIDTIQDRNLVNWWAISFSNIAKFASWVPVGGGRSMLGGISTTVKIPKCEFHEFNKDYFEQFGVPPNLVPFTFWGKSGERYCIPLRA